MPNRSQQLQVYLPESTKLQLSVAAGRLGTSVSAYARQAIKEKILRDNQLYGDAIAHK